MIPKIAARPSFIRSNSVLALASVPKKRVWNIQP
jgi:hypothetical protein